MRRFLDRLEAVFNDFKVRKKLLTFYICAVILPLVVADSFLLGILIQKERNEQTYAAQNIVDAVKYDLTNTVNEALEKSNSVFLSKAINDFLDEEYQSAVEYFDKKMYFKDTLYDGFFSSNRFNINIYVENNTIINGDHFQKISLVEQEEWYRAWSASGQDTLLYCYYDGKDYLGSAKRKFSLIRRLDYFKNSHYAKLIKIDMDYSAIVRKMNNSGYEALVYVCNEDRVIFANDGHLQYAQNFEPMRKSGDISYRDSLKLCGQEFEIFIIRPENTTLSFLYSNIGYILLLLGVSIFIPGILMVVIYQSFTKRLKELDEAFEGVKAESLQEIEHVRGKDEIGNLIRNYNHMVRRSRELIRVVYQNRLEKQEMDIARKNAELLALQSQINPHFLFNVLESIRMHSMLKGETETAKMIESLALLERENVNWSSDQVRISEEMQLIEAYLQIQRYRFGERLKYTLEISKGCGIYYIPKMTLVTFVENACVHGMEGKAAGGHIYVRVYEKQKYLYMEIEDTGCGMSEEEVDGWLHRINDCTIEDLKKEKQVGIINACLRLKLLTDGQTGFEIESELGAGTFILIQVPVRYLKNERGEADEAESNAGR